MLLLVGAGALLSTLAFVLIIHGVVYEDKLRDPSKFPEFREYVERRGWATSSRPGQSLQWAGLGKLTGLKTALGFGPFIELEKEHCDEEGGLYRGARRRFFGFGTRVGPKR